VVVWNRSRAKSEALLPFGVVVADTVADAVRGAGRVHLVLQADESVDSVIAAMGDALSKDVIICDHTTTQPALTAKRAERLSQSGVRYLHCPVFMGPQAARAAQGSMVCAGPRGWFDLVEPVLAKMTGKVVYVSERADAAAVLKLSGNAAFIGFGAVIVDALTICKAADVPLERVGEILGLFDFKAIFGMRVNALIAGDYDHPTFEMAMARKDVRLMQETVAAAGKGYPLHVLPHVGAAFDALIAKGNGHRDSILLGEHLPSKTKQ
jgi:3-hydroxyisobutyrate dehydrogenase